MSEDTNKENTASEEQSSVETENKSATENKSVEELKALNEKLYAETKSLRTESKDRRLKLEKFEKADQERKVAEQTKADEDLSYKDRYEKEKADHKADNVTHTQEKIDGQIKMKLIGKGLPEEISEVAVPSGTKEDEIDGVVDSLIEKFKTHVKPTDDASESLGASQPSVAKPKSIEDMTHEEKLAESVRQNNLKG